MRKKMDEGRLTFAQRRRAHSWSVWMNRWKGENCNQWFMINPRLFLNICWYRTEDRARKVHVSDQMRSSWLICSWGKSPFSVLASNRIVLRWEVGISEQRIDHYQSIHFVRERLIFSCMARFFCCLRRTLVSREFCFWQSKFCNMSQQIDNDRYWMRLDMNYYLVHTTVISPTTSLSVLQ